MPNPLFVLGAPRSGTTLVRSLLGGFEGIYLPPDELQILRLLLTKEHNAKQIVSILEKSTFSEHMKRRNLWPAEQQLLEVFSTNSLPKALQNLIELIGQSEGVTKLNYWGDKTPENVFILDLIFKNWPEAKIINVIRDPRDTVYSMHKSWGRSLVRGATIWRDAIRSVEMYRYIGHEIQIYDIKYELLTKDPEKELAQLAEWLGVEYDLAYLKKFSSEERWSTAKSAGIQNRSERWKQNLSKNELLLIEEICFEEMKTKCYEPSIAKSLREPSKMNLQVAKLGDAFRILQSYASERGWKSALSYKIRQWTS